MPTQDNGLWTTKILKFVKSSIITEKILGGLALDGDIVEMPNID